MVCYAELRELKTMYVPACVEEDQPRCDWQKWQEKLSRNWQHQRKHEQARDYGLDKWSRMLYYAERKDSEYCQQKILCIIVGPLVCSQTLKGIGWVEGSLKRGNAGSRRLSAAHL